LQRDELLDERTVGHLDEELALVAVVPHEGGMERRRPVVADEAQAGLVLKGADAVPRAAEDGFHQGNSDAVLRVVKVHSGPSQREQETGQIIAWTDASMFRGVRANARAPAVPA